MAEDVAGAPKGPMAAMEAQLPAGTELVYQLMMPVSISLGCSTCKEEMVMRPMASQLQMKGPMVPLYACVKCGKTVQVPAQFPVIGYTPASKASSAMPSFNLSETTVPKASNEEGSQDEQSVDS